MSQTETVMVFVLGFCSALLLLLMFGRSFWTAMGHWSSWKGKRGLPSSILDLQAERDSLKAERAILSKRLESGATDLRMRMAEQMAEVARNRNRVLDLNASLKASQAETEATKKANSELKAQISVLKAQIEDNVRTINEAWSKATDSTLETQSERKINAEAQREISEKRLKIKNFETEIQALREIIAMFVPASAGDDSAEQLRRNAQKSAGFANGFSEVPFALGPPPKLEGEPLVAVPLVTPVAVDVSQPANDEKLEVTSLQASTGDAAPATISEESENLAKGITNVLSLAERVRDLQKSAKA